ncbi:MAG: phosphate ABC transporter substrate-binding/OmpA family protein [Pseudomonadota bacterium]
MNPFTMVLAAGAALLGALWASTGSAQQVRLTSLSTGFVLTGDLIRFDGQDYVIRSSIGQLTVNGYDVRCDGDGCPKTSIFESTFGVIGSNMIGASLMPELIQAYSEQVDGSVERSLGDDGAQIVMRLRDSAGQEQAEITLSAPGSSAAFSALASGEATIGMSSRKVSDQEFAALEEAGIRDITRSGTEHVLAIDGLFITVANGNQLNVVNVDDLVDIFAGDIDNWADLGGPDRRINVYMREPGSGPHDGFVSALLTPRGVGVTPDAQFIGSSADLAAVVAADPYGIGVVGLAASQLAGRVLPIETACGLIIEPSHFNLQTEEYPLTRRLYLYTTGAPLPPQARGILEYALSDEAQGQIAQQGFVDQRVTQISLNEQGRRIAEAFIALRDPEATRNMRELALELLDADRMSTTIRFRRNSSVLDVKSISDLDRLARYIGTGALDGRELILIGFADDAGRFEANLGLSRRRASQIRAELQGALDRIGIGAESVDILELGYGDLAPVGCGDDDLGGVSNRRVEIWVRDRL